MTSITAGSGGFGFGLGGGRRATYGVDVRPELADGFHPGVDGRAVADLPDGCERNVGRPRKLLHASVRQLFECLFDG